MPLSRTAYSPSTPQKPQSRWVGRGSCQWREGRTFRCVCAVNVDSGSFPWIFKYGFIHYTLTLLGCSRILRYVLRTEQYNVCYCKPFSLCCNSQIDWFSSGVMENDVLVSSRHGSLNEIEVNGQAHNAHAENEAENADSDKPQGKNYLFLLS